MSLIAGHALASFVFDHVSSSVTLYVAVFYIPIFGGLFATCTEISRRFGSGRVRDDFGLSFAWGDTSLGLAIFVVSAICATLVQLPWLNNSSVDRTSDAVHTGIVSWPPLAIAELTVAAVIVAPLLEELAFRGVLERSLTPSMRLPWAIVLQALFFGAYHFTPGLGQYNLPRMLSAAAFGLVAGAAAARYRRLGPGVVAHALANVFVVIAVVTSHA
jgi:membrane protease YdiL (CAAX protease family)